MQVKQIDHLNLTVADFDASADWYNRVLGFEIVEQGVQDGQPWGVIKNGDAMLCIYQRPGWKAYDKHEMRAGKRHNIAHFALRIDDRDEWEQVLQRENLTLYYGGETSWPYSTAWYIRDPNGYEIEIAHWHDGPKFDQDAGLIQREA